MKSSANSSFDGNRSANLRDFVKDLKVLVKRNGESDSNEGAQSEMKKTYDESRSANLYSQDKSARQVGKTIGSHNGGHQSRLQNNICRRKAIG